MVERRANLYALEPKPRRWRRQYSIRTLLALQFLLAILLWLTPRFVKALNEIPETTLADSLPVLTFLFFFVLFVGVVAVTSRMRRQGAAFLAFSSLLILAMFWTLLGIATDAPTLPDQEGVREILEKEPKYVMSLAFRYFIPGMWSLVLGAGIGLLLRLEES